MNPFVRHVVTLQRYFQLLFFIRIKSRFPASLYIDGMQGNYKQLLDLEYYTSHLAAYGIRPIRGSYTSLKQDNG